MAQSFVFDAQKRNGWARGLIHFHTQFSDGWASVQRAGEMARRYGYDFLIVMDHLRDMLLKHNRTLTEYIAACDAATAKVKLPVIPGGEIEIPWNDPATADFSEAHALLFCVRAFADQQTSPTVGPLSPWLGPTRTGTVKGLQHLLAQQGLPSLAGHQFQHCHLSTKPGQWSDYRHDVDDLVGSRYLDFFYSSMAEVLHETEDIELVNRHAVGPAGALKGVFSSCDFHVGAQALWPTAAKLLDGGRLTATMRELVQAYQLSRLKLAHKASTAASPPYGGEQLSHATYVYLGDCEQYSEAEILQAVGEGKTCVTRGEAEFARLEPVPSFTVQYASPVTIRLQLPQSFSVARPRCAIVFRDGQIAHWEPYAPAAEQINFTWQESEPLPGRHVYSIYVPSKFLSSPIVVSA
jgi:hypothetical protein